MQNATSTTGRRVILGAGAFAFLGWSSYELWSPGAACNIELPAHTTHAAWMTHAWWGDAAWFAGSRRARAQYFGETRVAGVAESLQALNIADWFVHAGPATPYGELPPIDRTQARRLVHANRNGDVLAWVGGILYKHCFPNDAAWRRRFVDSCAALVLENHLAGIHLNIEPCPPFATGLLELLEELRAGLRGARLSVAAFPPPSILHPHEGVHWSRQFYREVSARADDLAVMMYDTALDLRKLYTWLVAEWTREVLAWSSAPVRIGIPAYDDVVPYHRPEVENVDSSLRGVASALSAGMPQNFAGWAVYAEWTLDLMERRLLARCAE